MTRSQNTCPRRPARILIVDDHPVVREGLAMRISRQPDLEVCGEAADIAEALQLLATTHPDVVVIDISLKSSSGLDLIKRVKMRNTSTRMLAWSMHNDSVYAERALHAGAMGYINKEHATDKIVEAIRTVLIGKMYLSEPMADRLLHRAVRGGGNQMERSPVEALSDRELEVFQLIGRGLPTHQVAKEMHVSPKTVETYRSRIKEKLQLRSAPELIHRAVHWHADNA